MTTAFMGAYRAEKATRTATNGRPKRTPILVHAGRLVARAASSWRTIRTATLSTTAFGGFTWAAWATDARLGAVVGATSLLVLEALTGDRR